MKRVLFSLVFILCALSLFSQSYREVRIYVPPIDGIGAIDDMAYFYKQITSELILQNRSLGKTRSTSDYTITGRLMPLSEVEGITLPRGSERDENILFIELFDNIHDQEVGTQFITYRGWPDESTDESLAVIIYNMVAGIPDLIDSQIGGETWRYKTLYLNLGFLWVPRVYSGDYQSVNVASVGVEVNVDFHFLSFMGVKAGAKLTQDVVVLYANSSKSYSDMILEFPVAISFILRPAELLLLEPYIGASFNISLLGTTLPFPLSWMAGVNLGFKAGIGIITIDPRFTMDFNKSYITSNAVSYWRYTINLGIGYKIGFIDKKR